MHRRLFPLLLGLLGCGGRLQEEAVLAAASSAPASAIHVFLVGDVLLGDAGEETLEREGDDYPFRAVLPLFREADLIVGNLEAPLTERLAPLDARKAYVYEMRPAIARALEDFGFDLFSLANNHALDHGLAGLEDTLAALDAAGIEHFGAGRSEAEATAGRILEREGVRIGFLAFMDPYGPYADEYEYFARGEAAGVAELSEAALRSAVARLRPRVDVLIACLHWGENYEDVTGRQVELGRLVATLGFDLVFGHHPHVAQGVEVRRGVPVLYSLGNFTFCTKGRYDKLPDRRWHKGWIADVWIEEKRVRRIDLIPIDVDNRVVRFQPRPSDPAVLPDLLELVNARFETPLQVVGDRARLELVPD
jgi:poly-gamma-glutamate synthesis protein (capsule biosynthesis protein)